MGVFTIALFGEAEKGEYHTPYLLKTLPQLEEHLGNPPANSKGLFFAIQSLLYQRELLFFRVKEEGFSLQDYLKGLHLLENRDAIRQISAICLPGVGDQEIIHATIPICLIYHSILITTEADLYDYLMAM